MAHAPQALFGLLESLSGTEVLVILVVALVVLGPEKLPGVARQAGVWFNKIREMAGSLQNEVRDVLDDPAMQQIRELGEFAAQPRKKLAEYARTLDQPDPDPVPEPVTPEAVVPDLVTPEAAEATEAGGEVPEGGEEPGADADPLSADESADRADRADSAAVGPEPDLTGVPPILRDVADPAPRPAAAPGVDVGVDQGPSSVQ